MSLWVLHSGSHSTTLQSLWNVFYEVKRDTPQNKTRGVLFWGLGSPHIGKQQQHNSAATPGGLQEPREAQAGVRGKWFAPFSPVRETKAKRVDC